MDKVRYVGDHVAMVVAETLEQAKNAAELVEVDYEPLPAVVDVRDAMKPTAPPRCTTPRPTTTATSGPSVTRARSMRRSPTPRT